jgi:predicted TIM-barrel fold metal-dependent hydrolase
MNNLYKSVLLLTSFLALCNCNNTNSESNKTATTNSIEVENIIDTHAHVLMPGQEHGLSPTTPATPEELLRQMEEGGISQSGIISMAVKGQLEANSAHNDYLLNLAKDSPKFFAICSVHPLDGQAALDEVARVAKLGAKAIKIHPFFQGFDMADSMVSQLIKVAGDNGLTVLIDSISPADGGMVGKFVNVALANPKTKIVLAHMGGTRFGEMVLFHVLSEGPWYQKNVYFDLSAVASLYSDSPRKDELIWSIRKIGIDQFMFASDFPIFDVKKSKDVIDGYGFTDEELQKLYHDNAVKVYNLTE